MGLQRVIQGTVVSNKMDKTGADFQLVLSSMEERLGANAVPIQWPMGQEDSFRGIIDLVEMKAYTYLDDLGPNLKPARALGWQTVKVVDPADALAELASLTGVRLA